MAELNPTAQVSAALPHARQVAGEAWLARILRTGAVTSGLLFAVSIVLEPVGAPGAADLVRKVGASVLIITPVLRLAAAGALLGLRGERRYAVYAAGVLVLLALSVLAGFSA